MTFKQVFNELLTNIKKGYTKNKSSRMYKKYKHSENLKLSKLYGYTITPTGEVKIKQGECDLIKKVNEMIANEMPLDEVKKNIDLLNYRTRGNNRWSVGQLKKLVRLIYTGYIKTPTGKIKSFYYPELVPYSIYKKAKKIIELQKKYNT